MDGYELAQRLRERIAPEMRLIAITGYGHPSARARAEQVGFEAHFIKPVDLASLRQAINHVD